MEALQRRRCNPMWRWHWAARLCGVLGLLLRCGRVGVWVVDMSRERYVCGAERVAIRAEMSG